MARAPGFGASTLVRLRMTSSVTPSILAHSHYDRDYSRGRALLAIPNALSRWGSSRRGFASGRLHGRLARRALFDFVARQEETGRHPRRLGMLGELHEGA